MDRRVHGLLVGAVMVGLGVGRAAAACPSMQSGVGAVVATNGVAFRVWAPNASAVAVAGTFNNWNSTAHPLCAEGNGYWSADVPTAQVGSEYKYVVTYGGQTYWRKDPRSFRVVNSAGNSVVYDQEAFAWTDAGSHLPGAERMVIYEMHVGTFHDPNRNDSTPATFAQAAAKLDYLAELGVNMIKVMPCAEFPGDYSWGYNPADLYAVESVYGGAVAFKSFINQCHARGIGVILDVVYNHLGPSDLATWQFDGWSLNNKGGIYYYQDWRSGTPWGDRPDYGRNEVREFLQNNLLQWAIDYHIDGFRFDATAFIRNVYGNNNDPANDIPDGWNLLQWMNNSLDPMQPWVISIAEDLRQNEWITKGTGAGGAGFDSQWDGAMVNQLRPALEASSDSARSMTAVRDALAFRFNNNVHERIIYTESHDAVANGKQRVPPSVDAADPASFWARKRSTLGAALVLSAPGIPMLFQGQEFLEDGWFDDHDPLDWSKTNTHAGIVRLYRDLIRLRKNGAGNSRGLTGQSINVFHVNDVDKVMAYHRWDQGGSGDDVVVAANFSMNTWMPAQNYRIGFPRGGTWYVIFNSDASAYGADFNNIGGAQVVAEPVPWNGLAYSATISLGRYSAVMYSQVAPTQTVDLPPTVALTAPAAGAVVTGAVNLAATASDDLGIIEVRFYVDGVLLATDATAPYGATWNSASASNGSHTLLALAVDTAGQQAQQGLSVTVSNPPPDLPPSVTITAPAAGAVVTGSVGLAASASDDLGVRAVQFYMDGQLIGVDSNAPYSVTWNSLTVSNGLHTLNVLAIDTASQSASAARSFSVSNRPAGFLSSYASMTLAGTFNGWNPALNNMSLISNYTWRTTVAFNNTTNVAFKFAANGNWTANWGDDNQPTTKPPINGTAEALGKNISVSGKLTGTYVAQFNEQTRAYRFFKQ